jgi:hypothetical protein
MIKWPDDVIRDIARRRCVLFLGAGISRNCTNAQGRHPKTWQEFLQEAVATVHPNMHIRRLIVKGDFLTACEVLKRSLGRDTFVQKLREEFLLPGYKPAPIHEHIFRLDSRVVATPNFDKIYESYANHAAGASIVVKHQYDPDITDAIRDDGRLILKIHGSIDSPNRMIFTRSEYAKARSEHHPFYQILDALVLTHTFVFLGCGVNDPDLKLLLEDAFFRHPMSRSHIIVLPKGEIHDEVVRIIEETMNLRVLVYSPKNNHIELSDSLGDLSKLIEVKRDELRQSGNW